MSTKKIQICDVPYLPGQRGPARRPAMTAPAALGQATQERRERAILLAWLAQTCVSATIGVPPDIIAIGLKVGSAIACETDRNSAWAEYVARVKVEHDLSDERAVWDSVDDQMAIARRTALAADIAARRSAAQLDVLLGDAS